MTLNKLKIGQVGVGTWGKNHCEILSKMPDVDLIGLHDINFKRSGKTGRDYATREFEDLSDLLKTVDALVVTAPTAQHFELAWRALNCGKHVFLEKPMCTTAEEGQKLAELSARNNLVLQVGHIERFNPAFVSLRKESPDPIFIETRRLAPFSQRGTDMSVVKDLMIHDLDLIMQIVSHELKTIDAIGLTAVSDRIDFAQARLVFENGSVASLTASRIAPGKLRTMELLEKHQHFMLDFVQRRTLKHVHGDDGSCRTTDITLNHTSENGRESDPLSTELNAFVRTVQTRGESSVNGFDGLRALKLAVEIEKIVEQTLKSVDLESVTLSMARSGGF